MVIAQQAEEQTVPHVEVEVDIVIIIRRIHHHIPHPLTTQ